MRIDTNAVKASIHRLNFKPEQLSQRLGDGDREKFMSSEQRERIHDNLLQTSASPEQARDAFERVIAGNDLVGINYLERGTRVSRAVCRVNIRSAEGRVGGYGTGFLIAPGVLITNHHVFGSAEEAAPSTAHFGYETDIRNREQPGVEFAFEPARLFYANKELDFAVVAVSPRSRDGSTQLSDFGWLQLNGAPGKGVIGEYLTIIQHPGGERKQICVRENKLLKYMDQTLWYATDTVAGSSGSPVFNQTWQVVALHHSGVPKTDEQGNWLTVDGGKWDSSKDESQVLWIANEGIRISAIVEHLRQRLSSHPLVRAVLEQGNERAGAFGGIGGSGGEGLKAPNSCCSGTGTGASFDPTTGAMTVTVPLRLTMQIGDMRSDGCVGDAGAVAGRSPRDPKWPPVAAAAVPSGTSNDTSTPAVMIEKVEIDTSNYSKRPGYDPLFLGKGALAVPLPALSAAQAKLAARLKGTKATGADAYTLKYWNYSVVMNAKRRLAFFSAVNIDGKLRRDTGKREGDSWISDSRIDAKAQVDQKFYGNQLATEATRDNNPFDRGHLVRRLDATWGTTEALAKVHGDDTFHFTNCTPQHYIFNQGKPPGKDDQGYRKSGGKTLWAAIEDYVLSLAENTQSKASVLNGPVFGDNDPDFNGVLVPLQFWKVAVFVRAGKLSASAYLLSQEKVLTPWLEATKPQEALASIPDDYAKLFQVSLKHLASMTGLDFGPLAKFDSAKSARESFASGPVEISSLLDVQL